MLQRQVGDNLIRKRIDVEHFAEKTIDCGLIKYKKVSYMTLGLGLVPVLTHNLLECNLHSKTLHRARDRPVVKMRRETPIMIN